MLGMQEKRRLAAALPNGLAGCGEGCESGEGAGILEVAIDEGVGRAIDEGENGGSGIGGSVLGKGGAAENEKIGQLPVLQVGVDDGVGGRIAHDRAALDVSALVAGGVVGANAGKRVDFFGVHGAGDFYGFWSDEVHHVAFVLAPVESETQERVT